MKPLVTAPSGTWRAKRFVLLDTDDTLTTGGRLTAESHTALEALQ